MHTLKPNDLMMIDTLFETLAATFCKEGRPGGDLAGAALLGAKAQPFCIKSSAVTPGYLMEKASTQVGVLPLADVIQSCWHIFSWVNWGDGTLTDKVASNLYTTELVGPDGHFEDVRVRVGLLISDSATDYPISSHSGEETYFIVTGSAEWSVDGGPYKIHRPGTFVHHPAWVPHGRRTLEEVFLGVWRWSGDLNLDSFSVADKE